MRTRRNPFPKDKAKEREYIIAVKKRKVFDFSNQNADGDDLSDLDLRHVNFKDASLVGVNFRDCDLRGVNFRGADLSEADFTDADLEGANLANANIENTSFQNANLSNANIGGISEPHFKANFENANLSGLKSSDERFIELTKFIEENGYAPDIEWGNSKGEALYTFALSASVVNHYHRELTSVLSSLGVDAFRIRGGEDSPYKHLTVCCGGTTKARIEYFRKLMSDTKNTKVEFSTAKGKVQISNSLIGYMLAQVIILCFKSKREFEQWVDDGVELAFLQLTQPINKQKQFVIQCPQSLDLDELKQTIGADFISDKLEDWDSYLDTMGENKTFSYGGMVLIPSGTFKGIAIEKPFLMSQAEITQDLYAATMGYNPSSFRGAELPVESVSWFGLLHLSNNLSDLSNNLSGGVDACYTYIGNGKQDIADWNPNCIGFRLPTEKEWEYACRAFSAYEYSGSNDPKEVAWFSDNSKRQTHSVGQLKPNALGTYDMSGNVWEWCWDECFHNSAYRALCGGAWHDDAVSTRAAYRYNSTPANQHYDFGGRLARSLP